MSRAIVVLLIAVLASGCRNIEVEKAVQITDVQTGWYDAGIVEGQKNKLVPSISLRLQNISQDPVDSVQINAIFRRVGEQEEWGEHFVMAIPRNGLAPGAKSNPIVLRSTARLHRHAVAAADAAEPRVRGREGGDLRQSRLAELGEARGTADRAGAADGIATRHTIGHEAHDQVSSLSRDFET